MGLKIINRSTWPSAAINVIVRWVCRRERLGTAEHPYEVLIRNTKKNTWGGRGSRSCQRIWLHRRYQPRDGWPYQVKDPRFKQAPTYSYRSRLELLVMLLAHEAHHAVEGHPDGYRKKGQHGYRIDREAMEYDCNLAGHRAVEAFRQEWPQIRTKIMAAMREERRRTRAEREKRLQRRCDPGPKILAAEAMLDKWRRKLKLAQTKVKKYQRKLAYHKSRLAALDGPRILELTRAED